MELIGIVSCGLMGDIIVAIFDMIRKIWKNRGSFYLLKVESIVMEILNEDEMKGFGRCWIPWRDIG